MKHRIFVGKQFSQPCLRREGYDGVTVGSPILALALFEQASPDPRSVRSARLWGAERRKPEPSTVVRSWPSALLRCQRRRRLRRLSSLDPASGEAGRRPVSSSPSAVGGGALLSFLKSHWSSRFLLPPSAPTSLGGDGDARPKARNKHRSSKGEKKVALQCTDILRTAISVPNKLCRGHLEERQWRRTKESSYVSRVLNPSSLSRPMLEGGSEEEERSHLVILAFRASQEWRKRKRRKK